ncbi:sulfite reductase (NADPH) hemoprotein beta-component [Candidatus Nasuia deltocephalinicola str. NAS-ALF]|uniref:Sulfite reductase (NADPH) hemoprotein beta-component n=1 Tax=Candidatus Nasuia deltocephalinicola str. NAS-ALF TaxID=1343077 RepID=S5SQ83_9PROT|nr:sulfite reductase (NADPH) hemoprotein beta-component [Candidatus Nasuia deltocephalinicola str. NAS-ALF]
MWMRYGFYFKLILLNYINIFNKNLINYFSGRYNENEFKSFRLKYGIYRQLNSYMIRFSILCGKINIKQLLLFSYVSLKYDKYYLHLTTRTNIQLNWFNIFYSFEILKKILYFFLNSIQSSGNCVRNITYYYIYKNFNPYPFCEILRQWFVCNSEFLFLPRKFKISVLNYKKDIIAFKEHDLGIYFKKNNLNNIKINISAGGGLGRTPTVGLYILKNINWKNLLNYCDKILRIYNIYGFRNNIYKSRLKILLKLIDVSKFLNFINKEFNYSINKIFFLNEKELNSFFKYENNLKFSFFKKNLIYFNFFFLNWIKFNIFNYNNIILPLKMLNKPSGDLNYIQCKILYYFSNDFFLHISVKQNLILKCYKYFFCYIKLKKYFINIYNSNLITDNICCPGKDYCVLANSKSILISNLIKNIFINMNDIFKINKIYLNISGCINSCGHHHISNVGFLGLNKGGFENYQVYIGGNYDNFKSSYFSKSFSKSFSYFKLSYYLIKIFKKFLLNNKYYNFLNFYNRLFINQI